MFNKNSFFNNVDLNKKDYNKNLFNFNNSKDLNIDIKARINNFKLDDVSYEKIDIKANQKDKSLLIDHIKIFHSDQSFINIAGNIDQNISSKKQHFDLSIKAVKISSELIINILCSHVMWLNFINHI